MAKRNKERRAYLKHRKPMANLEQMKLFHGNVQSKGSDYLNSIFYATQEAAGESRRRVLKYLEDLTKSVDRGRHVVLIGGRYKRLVMFFTQRLYSPGIVETEEEKLKKSITQRIKDAERNVGLAMEEVFFIENDIRAGIVKRSVHYPNRDRAMLAFNKNRIIWVRKFIHATSATTPQVPA